MGEVALSAETPKDGIGTGAGVASGPGVDGGFGEGDAASEGFV